jgi:two-component system CheB/CheR fusion protein
MVVFSGIRTTAAREKAGRSHAAGKKESSRIRELERELVATREHLQSTIEELETSNEELKSTNEELQSANEEMQSTNEELETSREELQSVNEELVTVNSELQMKVEQISQINNDMNNLLTGTEIATIFLDNDLRIKRFTPAVTKIVCLIDSDIGRPIRDIAVNVADSDILQDMRLVLDTLVIREREIRLIEGGWYFMRIIPYRTSDNIIDGLVATFTDITLQKLAEETLRGSLNYVDNILETVREPLVVLSADLTVLSVNRSFYTVFRTLPGETVGKKLPDLGNGQWNIPLLLASLEGVLESHNDFDNLRVEHNFESIGRRVMLLNAREITQGKSDRKMILLAIEDITPGNGNRGDAADKN